MTTETAIEVLEDLATLIYRGEQLWDEDSARLKEVAQFISRQIPNVAKSAA